MRCGERRAVHLGFAKIGFVGLDHFACAAHRLKVARAHGLTEAVHHEPCALVANAEHTVDLMGARCPSWRQS